MKKKAKTNYQSFKERVLKARTPADFQRLDVSLDRLYNAGCLKEGEFTRMCNLLTDTKCKYFREQEAVGNPNASDFLKPGTA